MLSDERLIQDMFGIKYPKNPTAQDIKEYNRKVEKALGTLGGSDPQNLDKILGNLTENNEEFNRIF